MDKITKYLLSPLNAGPAILLKYLWMLMLVFFFRASCLMAQSEKEKSEEEKTEVDIGELPVPDQKYTEDFLTLKQHGTLLENDQVTLEWEENGNLTLYFYRAEILWSTNTKGRGSVLSFKKHDGRLAIENVKGDEIWSSGGRDASRLELKDNGNLVMLNSGGREIWQSNTAFKYLSTNGMQRIDAIGDFAQNFRIPDDPAYKYLYLRAEGADGGKRKPKDSRFTVKAGAGATVKAIFPIGDGEHQIPRGAVVRCIVGFKGATKTHSHAIGAPGGAGTGVLFKKKDNAEWRLLMVAGGGGGAFSDCCLVRKEGKAARSGEDGTKGGGRKGGAGGKYGQAGANTSNNGWNGHGTGGGGAYIEAYDDDDNDEVGKPGWWLKKKDPWKDKINEETAESLDHKRLPMGGKGGYHHGSIDVLGYRGPWGFGGGGAGGRSGGGGGGYSGGGGGAGSEVGGGAGSYLDADMAIFGGKFINGTVKDTRHGFVEYKLMRSFTTDQLIHNAVVRDKCLDIAGPGVVNDTNIRLSKCNGRNHQRWHLFDDNIFSGADILKCVDLAFNKTSNGTNIRLWDCNNSNAQRWIYDGVSKQIRYRANLNKCLDNGNNGNIRLWDCLDISGQQWKIDGGIPIAIGTKGNTRIKTIHLAKDDGKCINLDGANTGNKTSNIHLYDCTGYGAQKWLFDGINIRYYGQQNKCVDLAYNKTDNGTNIRLWDCNRSEAQHWIYDGMTGAIRYWKNPDKCLVAKGGNTARGTNIEIRDCDGSEDQQWKIKDAATPFGPYKVKTISRVTDPGKCMDVDGGGTTNIQLWHCTGNTNQQWIYDGLYLRHKKDPSKCLDLKAANTHKGNNIQLYPCNGTKAQRWLYDQANHRIRYADNWNRCLEVYKDDNKAGTNIQIYDCRDTNAQRWVIK